MSLYKQARKTYLKQLTKDQRKQLKGYVQDIADEMLEAYAETIRLNRKASKDITNWLPIEDTKIDLQITIKLDSKN